MTKITFNDGMKIYWDHPIEMDDGLILRADIFCSLIIFQGKDLIR